MRRDKTFFFSYQGTNLRQTPASNSAVTLSAAQRAGALASKAILSLRPINRFRASRSRCRASIDRAKILGWTPPGCRERRSVLCFAP
jgi:hypothetical protein